MATLTLLEGLTALERRTRFVRITLLAFFAISLADMAVVAAEMTGTIDPAASELDLAGSLGALVHVLFALILLVAVVFVAQWIYRAHANLRAAEIDGLSFTPGWAVGWYFIPFANLIKPFQAMRELWNASLALDEGYGSEADPRLKLWWGAWIGGNILSNIGTRMEGYGTSGSTAAGAVLDIVSTAVLVAAGWFLLQIVETVNGAQRSGATMAQAFA